MTRQEREPTELEEQLAESQAQIEALQTSAADAEARAVTAQAQVAESGSGRCAWRRNWRRCRRCGSRPRAS